MIKSRDKSLIVFADRWHRFKLFGLQSCTQLSFSLTKALKSTHRHPLNKILHAIGLPMYVFAIYMLIAYLTSQGDENLMFGLALWLTAIGLFILGHRIEGNVRAMTIILLLKYIRSKLSTRKKLQKRQVFS
jgi:uncharacterized membrane protein YGL010W